MCSGLPLVSNSPKVLLLLPLRSSSRAGTRSGGKATSKPVTVFMFQKETSGTNLEGHITVAATLKQMTQNYIIMCGLGLHSNNVFFRLKCDCATG